MTKLPKPKSSPAITWLPGLERIHAQHPNLTIETIARVDSTQDQVNPDSVLIANEQTAGVGRHGNQWLSPAGRCICFSYCFTLPLAARMLSGYQLTIGLALVNTLKNFGCHHDKLLKWPNDLQLEGEKFAGILINLTSQQKQTQVTIGIGINWTLTDKQLATVNQPVSNVPLMNKPPRADFINRLITTLNQYRTLFIAEGLKPFLAQWPQYDVLTNQHLNLSHNSAGNLTQGEQPLNGEYHGLNQKGELLLDVNGQITAFGSGEVKVRTL